MLSPKHVKDLIQYFGIGTYERSPSGAILERAELFAIEYRVSPEMAAAIAAREPWEAPPDALTARPTCEDRTVAKSEPDLRMLEIYGRVSRRLKVVAMTEGRCAAALEALYGDAGHRWARSALPYGSMGALFCLTKAGAWLREWQRRKSRGTKLRLSDAERMENAVHAAASDVEKQELLNRAVKQAHELKERAEELYEAADGGER
jgi:hypothetical protein